MNAHGRNTSTAKHFVGAIASTNKIVRRPGACLEGAQRIEWGSLSGMVSLCFPLPPELFVRIFPFYLAFDRDMDVVEVGEVLQRI